jgi:hypothetical protein
MRRTPKVRHFHGRTTVRRGWAGAGLLVAGVLAASCSSEPPPHVSEAPSLEAIPAEALPGHAARPVDLDARGVSADAIDVDALETLLKEAGFVAATQRQFSRTAGGRRLTLARVVVFETQEGAETYLRWLEDHVDEVIGMAESVPGLSVPDGTLVYVHEPNPCCHNETRLVLAAWKDGATVMTLEVGGQVVKTSIVPGLVSRLDAAI